jgi:hypothetical protein
MPFGSWDPLLQRRVVFEPSGLAARTPSCDTVSRPSIDSSAPPTAAPRERMMPPQARLHPVTHKPVAKSPATPAPASAATGTPMTPAEMEAQSLALAYQLQQEEHAAFMQAVRVNSPAPRSAPGAPAERPEAGHDAVMDTAGTDDESLRLAMQLQEEELRWQQLQSQRALSAIGTGTGGEIDEDLALAMRLQREEDEM